MKRLTGYTAHGWRKGTVIRRGNRRGVIQGQGEYIVSSTCGLWWFPVRWEDSEFLEEICPMTYDVIEGDIGSKKP